MEIQTLKDPGIFPGEEVLKKTLGSSFNAYEELMQKVTGDKYKLDPQWNYYKDGKAWLCKVCLRKKTIFWLSAWEKYFKVSFFFTENTGTGLNEIDLSKPILKEYKANKAIGKLKPMILKISSLNDLKNVLKVLEYKINLK